MAGRTLREKFEVLASPSNHSALDPDAHGADNGDLRFATRGFRFTMFHRWMLLCFAVLVVLPLAGCGGGIDVNTRSLGKARSLWESAKIPDYDLEWTTSGERDGHYLVYVREGKVQAIDAYVPDLKARLVRQIRVKPGDPSYYGVDGLFKIMKEELAQLEDASPFGRPKGTQVILRFTPDTTLGFPKLYRRDVMGSPKGLSVDVFRLDRKKPGTSVPPAP